MKNILKSTVEYLLLPMPMKGELISLQEILQTCCLILKTIMIFILLPHFSIAFKYLMLQFRLHIELQNLRRKHPVLKTLNFPEVLQYVVCIKRNCFLYCETTFKTTWEYLTSPRDLSKLFYWLLRSKMSYKLEKKKKLCTLPAISHRISRSIKIAVIILKKNVSSLKMPRE